MAALTVRVEVVNLNQGILKPTTKYVFKYLQSVKIICKNPFNFPFDYLLLIQ